jgi:hypothetical protein
MIINIISLKENQKAKEKCRYRDMRRKDTRITRIKFINRSKFVLIVIFYRLEDLVALEVGLAVPVLAGILSKLSRRKAPVSSLLPKK